jgi:hypothetical protein
MSLVSLLPGHTCQIWVVSFIPSLRLTMCGCLGEGVEEDFCGVECGASGAVVYLVTA